MKWGRKRGEHWKYPKSLPASSLRKEFSDTGWEHAPPPYIRSQGTVQSDQYCTFHHKRARSRVAAACESRVCCCVIHWSLCAHERRGGAQLMGEGGWHRDVWDETRELASLGTLTVDHYQKKDEPNLPTGMQGGTLSPISRGRSFRCCSHLPRGLQK